MWKDYLYFTKTERRGILILAVLVIAIFAIPHLVHTLRAGERDFSTDTIKSDKEYADFMASLQEMKTVNTYPKSKYKDHVKRDIILRAFDPNTADSITFLELGLPPYLTSNILRYRRKKGVFRKKEDFKKIYGLPQELYATLLPYMQIAAEHSVKDTVSLLAPVTPVRKEAFKYEAGTMVDLNKADTTELKKIPGIGSGIAGMIVRRRAMLGGFYNIEQLEEIRINATKLRPWFLIDANDIRRINLNKASIERMMRHPYINYYQAKAIAEYRKKKGKLTDLKMLSLYEEFTPKDMERITPYVCYD